MTSQPWSFSHRIATEVSRPPEYARTSFFCSGTRKQLFQSAASAALAQDSDDRVVARDRARDSGQSRLVDTPRDHVRRPGRGLDHGHRLYELDGEDELTHKSG